MCKSSGGARYMRLRLQCMPDCNVLIGEHGYFLNWNLDALRYIAFYGHSSIKLHVLLIVVVCAHAWAMKTAQTIHVAVTPTAIGGRSKFLLLACGSKKGWNLLHYSRYCWMHVTTINFFMLYMLVQPCITYSMNHTPLRQFNNETPWDSMRRYWTPWDIMSHIITCMCNQSNETCTCNKCLSVISVSSWVSAFFVCFVCVCQCMGGACMLFTTAWLKP